MKTLIIAEKPSVAADLARVLGKVKKQGDYYENEELVISCAVGHLVELFMPEDIDPKLKRWTLASLPILPEKFALKPIERTQKKFQELKKLMGRKDITEVVNACDAGREGELIFTYLYEQANCKKPVKRLWMMSMTPEGIREAYSQLREGKELEALRDAARSRSEADWLIGINGTRALTSRMYGSRVGQVATVGRVQTPTLTLVIDREREIRAFVPKPYWRIEGTFEISQGTYTGLLQKPFWKKGEHEDDRADRFWQQDQAQSLLEAIKAFPTATVTEEKKRSRHIAPRLYDLTTLQREANSRFGLPAGKTLQIAQSLYEKHKLITYPRTDSRALPQDYLQTCQDTLQSLGHPWRPHADKVIAERWVRLDKRIFNNKEVSDHFAIIPTKEAVGSLNSDEAKIYDMITKRFICVFYPPAEYDVTTRLSLVGEHTFKTEGKVLAEPGWLAVYGKEEAQESSTLPALSPRDGTPATAKVLEAVLEAEATRPPSRFTEATLLGAMESAGKYVEDEGHAEAMQERGLGTPATRAAIIDHLIREKYMERVERHLAPTLKAESLIDFLRAVNIDALTSPAMTGEWEFKLKLIQQGELSRKAFMQGIADMTRHIVDQTKAFSEEKTETTVLADILSPTDRQPMLETLRTYRSQDGLITIYKTIGNRKLEHAELKELLTNRRIGPLDNFRSKAGKPFSAMLELNEENKVKFVFDSSGTGAEGENSEPLDLTQFPAVGPCPLAAIGKCKSTTSVIKEAPSGYICEHFGPKAQGCSFRLNRTLLGKSLPREVISQLLHSKKTELIEGFRSNRTKRLFSAHLIIKDNGSIGFEFAPRAPKATGPKSKAKTAKSADSDSTKPSSAEA